MASMVSSETFVTVLESHDSIPRPAPEAVSLRPDSVKLTLWIAASLVALCVPVLSPTARLVFSLKSALIVLTFSIRELSFAKS